ncbi:MAG: hypothetical protein EOM91_15810 [Sphingobacteriia bacterium]|nr:hypothetical protein [Sphingobacteriia bacterium]NCC41100.1 hypothetical protein [Gammaproteobacteria bacterium]
MIRLWLVLATLVAVAALILGVRANLRASRRSRRDAAPRWLQAVLLWLLPLPVLIATTVAMARGLLVPLLGNGLGYGLYLAGAWLIWRGLGAERVEPGRPRIRADWPLKTLGGGLIGLATGITAWLGSGHHPAIAAAFALMAWLGCWLFHGGDRRSNAGMHWLGRRDPSSRARSALVAAEQRIEAIEQASRQIAQPDLRDRLDRIGLLAREILILLEEDPGELPRARRVLGIYLEGVQRVVDRYATTHQRAALGPLDERFRQVLEQIETVFREQRDRLVRRDVMDLDVEIEVLTNQLKREGLI